jgi:F-type H+-transporting ATPase subunit alpha
MNNSFPSLSETLDETFQVIDNAVRDYTPTIDVSRSGTVTFVGPGIVRIAGLRGTMTDELISFPGERLGMVFNVDRSETGVILLDDLVGIQAGTEARKTGEVLTVPVGDELVGRVVDPHGRPLDGRTPVRTSRRRPAERPAPSIMDRLPVTEPLQTGIKVVDAMIPIGRGQRELILGDRQTGKTAIALDTIINQHDKEMLCIYCAIGKRSSAIAKAVQELRDHEAMDYSLVVATTEEDPPGLQFVAAYAAMSMGEYFMEQGRDVLIVLDDLTRHARAYREVSLLLRRPPGREAYPGDIFYVHSRLLERSTHLKKDLGGGSLTALPIIETEAQNISAYIPTNLISITDGQIYLSPSLFQKGILPAVDVGKSVSRVGGKTQLPAFRGVASDLRLAYSQFEELEAFSRFGTRLDEDTKKTLEHGRRVREIFKQPQSQPLPASDQIYVLVAANEGLLDTVPLDRVTDYTDKIRSAVEKDAPETKDKIYQGKKLSDDDIDAIVSSAKKAVNSEGED